ncbi:MAG: hypothetical protein Tsb0021_17210 [Chlamydiales bacterium]
MNKYVFPLLLTCLSYMITLPSEAAVKGRVEAAPIYLHLRTIFSGQTNKEVDLYGGRADATLIPIENNGFCIKPFLFGGAGKDSDLISYGCGIGYFFPVKNFYLIPTVGISRTRFDIPFVSTIGNLDQKFRSVSYNVGGEIIYKWNECLYFTGVYQYGFAHTTTDIELLGRSTGHSQGSNYAAVIDYYIRECAALSLGFGYNTSLSRERHGLKGYGLKFGLAYLF